VWYYRLCYYQKYGLSSLYCSLFSPSLSFFWKFVFFRGFPFPTFHSNTGMIVNLYTVVSFFSRAHSRRDIKFVAPVLLLMSCDRINEEKKSTPNSFFFCQQKLRYLRVWYVTCDDVTNMCASRSRRGVLTLNLNKWIRATKLFLKIVFITPSKKKLHLRERDIETDKKK